MRWLWPGRLAGQLALLVGIALFVAQAINFALILHERRTLRYEQVAGPVAARVADAIDRAAQGRAPDGDHGRVRRLDADPIDPRLPREARVESDLRRELAEDGVRVGRIATGIRPAQPGAPPDLPAPRHHHARPRWTDYELLVAVEQPGRGWFVQRVPWPGSDGWLIWRLVAQTLLLYGMVLVPLLWIGRHISRPLEGLALAASRFRPGDGAAPLPLSGPHDVAAVIAAFNALRSRVDAMLDEKDRMLGAIGHDLRTPLAALRVRIESVEDDTDRARMIDTIAEMNRTLDDILSLARLGRPSEAPTEVDLAALVDAVVEDFRDLGADVTFLEPGRLTLRLRPSLIRRAVRNLIENAVKYGGSATVGVARHADAVTIAVADQGPGIPEDRLGDVFDAFTRLETSRNRETGGIGLGLALARAIVREAGGDIVLANRPNGGLLATIHLPR